MYLLKQAFPQILPATSFRANSITPHPSFAKNVQKWSTEGRKYFGANDKDKRTHVLQYLLIIDLT